MKLKVMGFSSPGKREEQQDSFQYELKGMTAVAVVCDGMGGMVGGSLASRYAVNRFMHDYKQESKDSNIISFLKHEVIRLDDAVFQMKDPEGNQLGAGTTLVAAIIRDMHLYWLSVGDSKLYIYRNHTLRCMTREHNYRLVLDEMKDNECLTEEGYRKEAERADGLISFLGMGNVKVFDVNECPFNIQDGDRFLLCSDGIYKTITDDFLEELFQEYEGNLKDLMDIMEQMIDENDIENQDNATLLLLTADEGDVLEKRV